MQCSVLSDRYACPVCGADMAPNYSTTTQDSPTGIEYTVHTRFVWCVKQGCPNQFKKLALPKVELKEL